MQMTDAKLLDLIDDAYSCLSDDDLEGARARHAEACRVAPDQRDVLLLEVDLLEAEENGEEAVAACEEIRDRFRGDAVVDFRYAALLLDVYDDVEDARTVLEGVLKKIDTGSEPTFAGLDAEELKEARAAFRVEVLLTLSDVRAATLDPHGAHAAATEAAELDRDDPMARLTLASADFDLGNLEEAERSVARAIDLDPQLADAYWLRGRILTLRGDDNGATRAFARASQMDPERFTNPVRMDEDTFAALMEASLEELPEKVRNYLQNVAIAVEDTPPLDRLKQSDPPLSPGLLGLYEGTPPSLASGDDPWAHHPRHITLFRKNLEISARDEDELRDLIATTLLHEIGHYLGLDEDDLIDRGLG